MNKLQNPKPQATIHTYDSTGVVHTVRADMTQGASQLTRVKVTGVARTHIISLANAINFARITEANWCGNDPITIDFSPSITDIPAQQHFELAAIIADRAVRGLLPSCAGQQSPNWWVMGNSDDWIEGKITWASDAHAHTDLQRLIAHPELGEVSILLPVSTESTKMRYQQLRQTHPQAKIYEISHLNGLLSRIISTPQMRRASAYYPLIRDCEQSDELGEVEIIIRPCAKGEINQYHISGIPPTYEAGIKGRITEILQRTRKDDPQTEQWVTLIHLPKFTATQQNSYELALVMADRLARGLEWGENLSMIATGAIDTTRIAVAQSEGEAHPAYVQTVQEHERKSKLIARHLWQNTVHPYRILLPKDWAQNIMVRQHLIEPLNAEPSMSHHSIGWLEQI